MILNVIRRNNICCEDNLVVQLKRVYRSRSHARMCIDAPDDQMSTSNVLKQLRQLPAKEGTIALLHDFDVVRVSFNLFDDVTAALREGIPSPTATVEGGGFDRLFLPGSAATFRSLNTDKVKIPHF